MKAISIIIVLSASLALAACSGKAPPSGTPAAPPPAASPAPVVGGVCVGKDSQGMAFKGTWSQETKGGLNCVAGGGAR